MIKAIAIDNDSNSLINIEKMCAELGIIKLEKTFTTYDKALKHVRKFPVDLIFVDIELCIKAGRKIFKNNEQQKQLIFTSSNSELASEAFEMNAIDFLLKPFSIKRFEKAIKKAETFIHHLHNGEAAIQDDKLCVRADYGLKILNPDDILFLESLGDYVTIFLKDQKKVITKTTMTNIHQKLNQKEFIRVNRSYIVPFSKVETFGKRILHIAGRDIVIGDTYKEIVSNLLLSKLTLNKVG